MSSWSRRHAQRLFWRAGFGATPAELDFWTRRTRAQAIDWLVHGGRGPHGTKTMVGAPPHLGRPLDPVNQWGDDVVWWLDKMVRSQRPLVERMTLFWHDHFATRDQDAPLMLAQNRTMRAGALGSFRALLGAITVDPAMQGFLSLVDSDKDAPNENFARELMELFTLGVGSGYTEADVREAARALTGFKGDWDHGPLKVKFDPERHDDGVKRLLGRRGRLDYRDVLDIVVGHRAHAPFVVGKLWEYFVTEPLGAGTRRSLVRTYKGSGHRIAPVIREILGHPALYADLDRPAMVKWPIVHLAGMLRAVGRTMDSDDWGWISLQMGQKPFDPPSVAGWDTGPAWMSTATTHGRFDAATYVCKDAPVKPEKGSVPVTWSADEHVARARAATGQPWTSKATDARLKAMASEFLSLDRRAGDDLQDWQAELTQAALRHFLLAGPDNALC